MIEMFLTGPASFVRKVFIRKVVAVIGLGGGLTHAVIVKAVHVSWG
jgi:hypothetical protein